MSEENDLQQETATPKDSRQSTGIDWSKDTPKTAEAWMALTPEDRLNWCVWHEEQTQIKFAAIATLLEIGGAAFAIYMNESGTGYSVAIGIVAFVIVVLTLAFSKFLYRAFRAVAFGILVAVLPAIVLCFAIDKGPLQTILIVADFVGFIALLGWMESKGWLSRKEPNFPPPKEPGVLEELNNLRKDMKKALANRPKKPKKPKRPKAPSNPNAGYGSWLSNTLNAWDKDGVTNTSTNPRPKI